MGERVAPRCKYGLYDLCNFWFATQEHPSRDDCVMCFKAYRLRHGLRTVLEAKGTRVGVTL